MFWILVNHCRPDVTSALFGDLNIKIGQASTCICLNIHMNYIQNSSSILNLCYCRMPIMWDLEFDQNNVRIIANETNKLFSKLSRKPIYFILRKIMPVSIIIKAMYKLPIFKIESRQNTITHKRFFGQYSQYLDSILYPGIHCYLSVVFPQQASHLWTSTLNYVRWPALSGLISCLFLFLFCLVFI